MIKYCINMTELKSTIVKCSIVISIIISNTSFSQFALQNAFPNLTFSEPLFLTNSGDGTNRNFVVEQSGRIKVFTNSSNTLISKTFLDITDRVTSGGETGLLGLAFHPDYQNNGYFYVNYTAPSPLRTIISRFQVTSNPDSANKNSEFQILVFNQPFPNHNGGWIGFGPNDGYLYIASGDGGDAGDPQNNGQKINTLLGKFLCIDVDGGTPYAIPTTNPFYDSTGSVRKEIYAWGLRNPWRCSFDPVTGWLWAADVGQYDWEEIDIIENGKNYGWRCYEGNHPFNTSGCNYPEYIDPIWEYPHGVECSITGGYVYRGATVPELTGKYIYGDYCSRKVWSLSYDGVNPPTNELLVTAPSLITSFGTDENDEIYITSSNGKIYRFTPTVIVNTFQLTVNVINGWNMVSAPGINPAGMGVATWWPRITGTVWGFNGTQYVSKTVATPGEGYWMKNTIAETYNYPAITIVPHNPVPVTLGWNLIGGYETSPTVANLKLANPQITGTVWGFNGTQYVAAVSIVPGYSYWVKVTSAGTITIPDAMAKGGEVVELYKEDWGRIVIRDAEGRSFTLYAVKGELDLNQYEMPPMPPAGVFDIRFSSGRIAEDINTAMQTIEMSGVTYPLTVRVEEMDIRLMDETWKDFECQPERWRRYSNQ